jgi:hypothetical protein
LANGTAGNTFNANDSALSITVTGGNANSTYNMGTRLDGNDTVTGTAGTADVMNVTGTGTGAATITAVETINFTTSTAAQTFTTGAIALPAAGTITAAGSTVAVSVNAGALNLTTSGTIIDGQGNDTMTVPTADGERVLLTLNLSSGGADSVNIVNTAAAGTVNGVTLTNFTTGITAAADNINLTLGDGDQTVGFQTVTAAATAVAADALTVEINSAVGAVTSFDAGAGGLVETLLAASLGTFAPNTGDFAVIVYGAGAQAGNAALYEVITTANNQDITAALITVELVGIFNGVTADSFESANFI